MISRPQRLIRTRRNSILTIKPNTRSNNIRFFRNRQPNNHPRRIKRRTRSPFRISKPQNRRPIKRRIRTWMSVHNISKQLQRVISRNSRNLRTGIASLVIISHHKGVNQVLQRDNRSQLQMPSIRSNLATSHNRTSTTYNKDIRRNPDLPLPPRRQPRPPTYSAIQLTHSRHKSKRTHANRDEYACYKLVLGLDTSIISLATTLISVPDRSHRRRQVTSRIRITLNTYSRLDIAQFNGAIITHARLKHSRHIILNNRLSAIPTTSGLPRRVTSNGLCNLKTGSVGNNITITLHYTCSLITPSQSIACIFCRYRRVSSRTGNLHLLTRTRPRLVRTSFTILVRPDGTKIRTNYRNALHTCIQASKRHSRSTES